ncbi:hypothetical protein EX30DRAFT_342947 [Ascodesmis nigricans]|uniref:Uncharacterized protein n=1 Tax=Ascodesmis nigricans TaxID=341454 RepID=A0A4V3SI49_9PEZI|nr:hypothetical protein EX30DRAFT_342947 [Ascodesmis nigricans]
MPDRWRCCQCDNNWMTVKDGANVCTMSDCQHSRCRHCETKWFSVAIDPALDRPPARHIFDVEANGWIPYFRTHNHGCDYTHHEPLDE